jgi:peptidoglycan hydrolase CwlO-like protein
MLLCWLCGMRYFTKWRLVSSGQAEATKARDDIEARNTTLHTDLTKAQRTLEDVSRKVASLQSLNDAQTQSIKLLEKDQETNKAVILEQEMKLRELVRSTVIARSESSCSNSHCSCMLRCRMFCV